MSHDRPLDDSSVRGYIEPDLMVWTAGKD